MQTLFFGFGFPHKFNKQWWKDFAFMVVGLFSLFAPTTSLVYGVAYMADLSHLQHVSLLDMQILSTLVVSLLVCLMLCDNTNEYSGRTCFTNLGKSIIRALNPITLFKFLKRKKM